MLGVTLGPDVSGDMPSLDVKKPKKGMFAGIFKKPSVKSGLKVSLLMVSFKPGYRHSTVRLGLCSIFFRNVK